MQLIQILLIAISIVVLLSGISIFFGSPRSEKASGLRFMLATLGAAIWAIAITVFISTKNIDNNFIHGIVVAIIGGITLCDVGLLAYLGWQRKFGKFATILFAAIGFTLVVLLTYDHSLFYSSVGFDQGYVRLYINKSWYYFALIAYFVLISIVFSTFLQQRIKATTNKGLKTGLKVFYVGLTIGGILALIFDLILITSHPHLVWIGPMATAISVLSFYYSVVKFRTLSMSSRWAEIMSLVILAAAAIIIYLLVFYIVFNALFGIPNPSGPVLALNVIMAVFLLLLMPTFSEVLTFMRATFFIDKIDLGYINKKLEKIRHSNFEQKDIATFLSDTMHYSYLALIIDGHLYSSNSSRFSAEEIERISHMRAPEHGQWILPSENSPEFIHERGITRIGIMRDKSGKELGKIIFGKRLSEARLSHEELIKHEAVIGLLSCVVEENTRK